MVIRRGQSPYRGIGRTLLVSLLVGCCLLLVWMAFRPTASTYGRVNVLVIDNPMVMASWDIRNHKLLLVRLPSDTVVDGVYGYGRYTLEALARLGEIDHVPTLLPASVQEALAVPVPWFLTSLQSGSSSDSFSRIRKTVCVSCLASVITGRAGTNLPLPLYISLLRQSLSLHESDVTVMDLGATSVLYDQVLPDGTMVRALDPERLDAVVGGVFEDEQVRREAKRVAVYNTTPVLQLAGRAGRLLGHIGALVIQLDSVEPMQKGCTVRGNKADLESVTGRVMRELYGCVPVLEEAGQRAQLGLFLGTEYAARFETKKKEQ